jgi:hypothetical protein
MQVSLHNNVKVYNLTAGKSLPEWLSAKRRLLAFAVCTCLPVPGCLRSGAAAPGGAA